MLGKQASDQRVHNAFGHFIAAVVQNGRIGHQMADIANQHGRQAGQRELAARQIVIAAVFV